MNQAVPKLMSKGAFAAHRGVGKSAVSNWAKAGHLVMAEGDDGKLMVDVARTEARLNAKIDPTRGRPSTSTNAGVEPAAVAASSAPSTGGLGEIRTELLREQRIGASLRNAREAGLLVAVEEYERRSQELGRNARERVIAVVRDQAEVLAAEREPRAIIALMTAEYDRVFSDLADQLEAAETDEEAEAPDEPETAEED